MKGKIPSHFITSLLARTDIVGLVEERLPLKRKGTLYMACCPFHQEKSPSFTVSATRQTYHCFGCGVHGNAVGFLMAYDHLSFVESIESLAQELNLPIPYEKYEKSTLQGQEFLPGERSEPHAAQAPEADPSALTQALLQAQRLYQWQLMQPQNVHAVEYLKSRGLSGEIAKRFALGYAPDAWDSLTQGIKNISKKVLLQAGLLIEKEGSPGRTYDRFRHRIMFPIRNRQGKTIGFGGRVLSPEEMPKYLNSPETPVFHKGRELYGLYELLTHYRGKPPSIIITEGYMDVIALAQYGFHNAVATLGTATTEDHLRILLRHTRSLVFCFDGDRAGREAAKRALQVSLRFMSGAYAIQFLFLPETDDPDSLLRSEGPVGFSKRLEHAQSLSETLLQHLQEGLVLTRLDDRAEMIHRFKDSYQRIPEGPFLAVLLETLSERSGLGIKKIESLLNPKNNAHAQHSATRPALRAKTLMEKALDYLIEAPSLALNVHTVLSESELSSLSQMEPRYAFFHKLVRGILKHQLQTTAQLIPYIAQHTEYQAYTARVHLDPSQGAVMEKEMIRQEFCDILTRLVAEGRMHWIKTLTHKAKEASLSEAEKETLQKLLQKHAKNV